MHVIMLKYILLCALNPQVCKLKGHGRLTQWQQPRKIQVCPLAHTAAATRAFHAQKLARETLFPSTSTIETDMPYVCISGTLGYTAQAVLAEEQLPQYGRSFRQLLVDVTPETATRLHIKVSPKGATRWEVPEFIVQR